MYNSGVQGHPRQHSLPLPIWISAPLLPSHSWARGGKVRRCPLWPQTVSKLAPLVTGREPQAPVFLNRQRQPITRFGIRALVKRSAQNASRKLPSLSAKPISTHTIRHTTAVHLLRSGVDINTIRAWLGHVCLDTTHIYAEVDLEMKAKALAQCEIPESATATTEHWSIIRN